MEREFRKLGIKMDDIRISAQAIEDVRIATSAFSELLWKKAKDNAIERVAKERRENKDVVLRIESHDVDKAIKQVGV